MEALDYAEAVIEQVHRKTLRGEMHWDIATGRIWVNPIPSILLTIEVVDVGPDSAIWSKLMLTHPVGEGVTTLANPQSPVDNPGLQSISGHVLQQVNEIFECVLLKPRRADFETALRQLGL